MAILWGVAGSVLARVWKGDRQIQMLVFMLVVSHWVLDFAPAGHASLARRLSVIRTRSLEFCSCNAGS
jgi:hypothetical protein